MDCCQINGLNQVFVGARVRRELKAFERNGLNERQTQILKIIENDTVGRSVLEIGCGIGALSTTLLTKGAAAGSYVEISADSLSAAQYLAQKADVEEKSLFYLQDFAEPEAHFSAADIVLLDRVVCCYPNGEKLIAKAAKHSKQYLIYTYPRPFWLLHVFRRFLNLIVMRLLRKDYRFFLHNPQRLLQAATKAGHCLVLTRPVGFWQLVVISKASP